MHILFKDSIKRMQVLGFVVAFVGVALVAFNGAVILDLNPVGDVLALTSALSWALYCVLLRLFNKDVDGIVLTRKMMFYGFVMGAILILIEGKEFDLAHLLEPMNMFGLFFLGVLGSCACFMLWNHSVKVLGVIKSNIFIYAMPVVTLIAGHIAFDETITVMAVIGMALVISGMLMANGRSDEA
jgi:drug/metabolite transporter (DMT)-like permease